MASSNALPIPAIGRTTLDREPLLAAKVAAEYQRVAALLRDRAQRCGSGDKARAARLTAAASEHYAEARSIMGVE